MAKWHTVKQGDCIASIAFENGFFPETIFRHPENTALRELGRDENVLLPGDRVFVPDLTLKKVDCATGRRHTFRRRAVPEYLRIVLRDARGEPLAGASYVLEIDGAPRTGTTSAEGLLEEPIWPNARRAVLRLAGSPREHVFPIGHLDPIDSITGVQARLSNLGYPCAEIDGAWRPEHRRALREFQSAHGLAPTGEIDDATRARLRDLHGC